MSVQTKSVETSAALPEPGTWVIDPAHSSIEITIRHLVLAKVRGRFGEFTGSVNIADEPLQSSASVEINTASIDTRNGDRDAHLRSDDFFATETYPTASFKSTAIVPLGRDNFRLDGELTIKDVTGPVSLDVSYGGVVADPWGNTRVVFSATTEIDREEFGLTWNQVLETGGVAVGKTAKLDIDVEAVRQQ